MPVLTLSSHSVHRKRSKLLGFTLSELLVSVAVLGIIAAFTIPKVLHSVEERRKVAVFKEIISSYEVIGWEAATTGTSSLQSFTNSNLNSKLQVVSQTTYDPTSAMQTLASGAQIKIEVNPLCGTGIADIIIDWNGFANLPNIAGEDVFCGSMNFGSVGGCTSSDFRGVAPAGRLYVNENCGAINPISGARITWTPTWPGTQMYKDIFK